MAMRSPFLAIALFATIFPAAGQSSEPDRAQMKNAALVYWPGFGMLPNLSDEENELLDKLQKLEAKAGEEGTPIAALLRKLEPSMESVDRALLIPKCDWELDYTLFSYPHLSKARDVVRGLALRARLRMAEGKPSESIKDICNALRMSRHIFQTDNMFVTCLMQITLESIAMHAVAVDFSRYDTASLETLLATLDTLPERITTSKAYAGEAQLFIPWLRAQIPALEKTGATPEEIQKALKGIPPSITTLPQLRDSLDTLERDYAQLVELAALPYPENTIKVEAYLKKIPERSVATPLSTLALPALTIALSKEFQQRAKLAMLRAAIAIRLHGLDALASIPDPMTGQPFDYKPLPDEANGFELISKDKRSKKPVSMTFR